jgi:Domain of unknown function (DUF4136)
MTNTNRPSFLPLLVAAAALPVGCYDPPTSTERLEQSIVITTRDESADFTAYRTFFVRPEIRVLDEDDTTGKQGTVVTGSDGDVLSSDLADPLIEATRQNLIDRGYEEARSAGATQLAVELVYVRAVYSDYYCYYWGDWGYWGYPGYSYYYPYGCTGSSWQSGMLVTQVTDLTSAAPPPPEDATGGVLRGIWYSGIYGVEAESADFVADRAATGIDQAFIQSPYFAASP